MGLCDVPYPTVDHPFVSCFGTQLAHSIETCCKTIQVKYREPHLKHKKQKTMSNLLKRLKPVLSDYMDGRFEGTQEEFNKCLRDSTTVYVGNLSFYTAEEQIHALFSRAGMVKEIIVGLDKYQMTPCGFCFVVYYSREDAENCVRYLNGVKLDDRPIRVDFDWGGTDESRRYGRGRSGGQVRDEHRDYYDPERGGWSKNVQRNLASYGKRQYEGGNDSDEAVAKRRRSDVDDKGDDENGEEGKEAMEG